MRLLIVFLAACASAFAGNISTTCFSGGSTITSQDPYATSCSDYGSSASGEIDYSGSAEISASASGLYPSNGWYPGASASLSFGADYILTVTGGTGGGFAEPQLYAETFWSNGYVDVGATASLGGCTAFSFYTSCQGPTPFLYNTPQDFTVEVSLDVSAGSGGGASSNGDASASWGGFEFFNAQMQPLSGVTYSFIDPDIPAPEPGSLPLLSGIACAALIALRQRHRS